MKTKIILSLVVLNILVGSLIFFMNPARVEAENALAPAAPAVQPPGPARNVQNADREVFTPADRLEIVRQKEERLAAREAELKELERQVSERIRRLEEIHSAIRNDLAAYRVVSGDRIKHLVKIYSSMKPNAAASLMNNLETDVAVEVFLGMKGDVAGGILSYMEPAKAALITQRLVSYRGMTSASRGEENPQ